MSELITEAEAADLIQMSKSWLRKQRYAGNGPRFHRIPGSRAVRYDPSEVIAWAKSESQMTALTDVSEEE